MYMLITRSKVAINYFVQRSLALSPKNGVPFPPKKSYDQIISKSESGMFEVCKNFHKLVDRQIII